MNQGESLKHGFEYAARLIKNDDQLEKSREIWEEDLVNVIIQVSFISSNIRQWEILRKVECGKLLSISPLQY